MKKRLFIILGLILTMFLSCGNKEDAVKKDFEKNMVLLKKGDLEKLGAKKEDLEMMKSFIKGYEKITYKINSVKSVSENEIILNVTAKYPDLSGSMQEFMKKAMEKQKDFVGKSDKELEEESKKMLFETIDEKLNSPNLKYKEKTMDVSYTKTKGKWELDANKNNDFFQVLILEFDK